ncbi:MAG: rhodanese-like domain-containing protein [Bdellovibrionales bacterium]|nr:rhodanese-like domain-containing protein [Bdellovibrionales bacterium]
MEFTSASPNPHFADVMDIDPKDVLKHQSELCIIDVRRDDEFTGELGHISSAKLITLDRLEEEIDSLPKDKPIVFVCRSGGRSAQASEIALDYGWENVYNMRGGMLLWNEYGLNVEK